MKLPGCLRRALENRRLVPNGIARTENREAAVTTTGSLPVLCMSACSLSLGELTQEVGSLPVLCISACSLQADCLYPVCAAPPFGGPQPQYLLKLDFIKLSTEQAAHQFIVIFF